ncbi:Hint domain-containing protein [Acidisoma cellulosilytica]|uniref:Hint domain-containing protein n=1 Tax=Acidisoma cellulosilyticum TaxID=2802395 RepID=A0A963Z6Z6_9PROT|nr:Hint domain-containing protein [Acidisoma cellulosilyticum]MCB8883972.1 Hint domain-containing protein [Acidisoma cellulosilyticum]
MPATTNNYNSSNNGQNITQVVSAITFNSPLTNNLTTTAGQVAPTVTFVDTIALGSITFNVTNNATAIVQEGLSVGGAFVFNANGGVIEASTTAAVASSQAITIQNGGTFEADNTFLGLLGNSSYTFGAATAGKVDTLVIGSPTLSVQLLNFTAPIVGFASSSEVIDNETINGASVHSYTITQAGNGVQTVTYYNVNGTSLGSEKFASGTFTAASLGNHTVGLPGGPLNLTVEANGSLSTTFCFFSGTGIRTPAGDLPVEELKIGDVIVTAHGEVKPVRWIGVNTVSTRFADPLRVAPIRIKAGALGNDLPYKDLLVSPDHAMFMDGCLVQAGAMVNGLSIVRETDMPSTFKYYHIEVENHCLVLAEGAPTETFVDNVDRMGFDNWDEYEALGIKESIPEMDYPRAQSARQIPSQIRMKISETAVRLFGERVSIAA